MENYNRIEPAKMLPADVFIPKMEAEACTTPYKLSHEWEQGTQKIPARWHRIGHSEYEFLKCPQDASPSLQTHSPENPKQILSMLFKGKQ